MSLIVSRRKRNNRSSFWNGFLIGFSGPHMLFMQRKSPATYVDATTAEHAWKEVGKYIRHGVEAEKARVEKARRKLHSLEQA